MKYRSTPDTVHWFLLVSPRCKCKCMPSMKPLSLIYTEKLTSAQKMNILIMRMCKSMCTYAYDQADTHGGYRISTLLLCKGMLISSWSVNDVGVASEGQGQQQSVTNNGIAGMS